MVGDVELTAKQCLIKLICAVLVSVEMQHIHPLREDKEVFDERLHSFEVVPEESPHKLRFD